MDIVAELSRLVFLFAVRVSGFGVIWFQDLFGLQRFMKVESAGRSVSEG